MLDKAVITTTKIKFCFSTIPTLYESCVCRDCLAES